MSSFGWIVFLLTISTLTMTRASSSEHENYSKEETNERSAGSKKNEEMEDSIRRYLRHQSEMLQRNGGKIVGKNRRSVEELKKDKDELPFSTKRFEKMLEKAIIKIITGDLSIADVTLLKSLNYSLEEVLAIRERELGEKMKESEIPETLRGVRRFDDDETNDRKTVDDVRSLTEFPEPKYVESNSKIGPKSHVTVSSPRPPKKSRKNHKKPEKNFDFDAYNRQAVYDYENVAEKIARQTELNPLYNLEDYEERYEDSRLIEERLDDDLKINFDRAIEPHVVFKIRYDDSEFDSTSDERSRKKNSSKETFGTSRKIIDDNPIDENSKSELRSLTTKSTNLGINTTPENGGNKLFLSSPGIDVDHSLPVVYRLGNFLTSHDPTKVHPMTTETNEEKSSIGKNSATTTVEESSKNFKSAIAESFPENREFENRSSELLMKNKLVDDDRNNNSRKSETYEGLEWVEDDVYRVIPQAIDDLNYDSSDNYAAENVDNVDVNAVNRTSDSDSRMFYDDGNSTTVYDYENPQNDEQGQKSRNEAPTATRMPMNNSLTAYQQVALAHRRDRNLSSPIDSQGQKAIEDIKLKVLAMTGRFNLSSTTNQVQRERLTMYSPACQPPRNTDLEMWSDPTSMNMYFQLNLNSSDHVVAARLRIYKLPQENVTGLSNAATGEGEDDEEKKIRISIYFYPKSLKKHRSKKRLMDSVVTALTSQGSHLALDVRQALRFWRQNSRTSSHGNHSNNNHGLVIQVEDQEGKPLKPSQYIQQATCHTSEQNEDDKINESLHSSFKPVLVTFVS